MPIKPTASTLFYLFILQSKVLLLIRLEIRGLSLLMKLIPNISLIYIILLKEAFAFLSKIFFSMIFVLILDVYDDHVNTSSHYRFRLTPRIASASLGSSGQ
jgi:hypothetical protein